LHPTDRADADLDLVLVAYLVHQRTGAATIVRVKTAASAEDIQRRLLTPSEATNLVETTKRGPIELG
jgi:hypothetical protein